MKIILIISLVLLSFDGIKTQKPYPTETYRNSTILRSPDLYYLYWNYNNQNITFEIHVKNAAWALFGVKGSNRSNVVVAAMFGDGTGHFSERTLNTDNTVAINPTLNWFLLDAFARNNYTVFKFYRNLKLQCNQANTLSLDITTGLNTLVFATGSTFNQNDSSIVVSNPTTTQVNILSAISTTTQLSCVNPPSSPVFNSTPTGYYSNSFDLIPGIYRVYWNITGSNITAEIHCKTAGWVGFGFSPNGAMSGSNVVVGYISSDSTVSFNDMYITGYNVQKTQNQSVTLLNSGYKNGYSYFKFTRPIILCDSQHLSINKGAIYLIFAFGTSVLAAGGRIDSHSTVNRGSKRLNFISTLSESGSPVPNTEIVDLNLANAVIPRVETYYYCKLFQLPTINPKRHIYKYQIILPKINEMNIHHLGLYECPLSFKMPQNQITHACFETEVRKQCEKPSSVIWATGGDLVVTLPNNTGYPIDTSSYYKYLLVEVHYNNPSLAIGYIDRLTVRFFTTKTLRKDELGTFVTGAVPSGFGIAIPPGLNNFNLYTLCPSSCMSKKLATRNMTIISAFPHTHTAGTGVETRILRKGVDIGPLFANPKYDFNFQQLYSINPPITLTKDDQLITTCSYTTKSRTNFTLGGFGTKEEMCLHYFFYYPRVSDFADCISFPFENDYIDLLNNMTKSKEISLNYELGYTDNDLTVGLTAALTQFYTGSKPTTSSVVNKFVEFFNSSRLGLACGEEIDKGPISRVYSKNRYVEPNVCARN